MLVTDIFLPCNNTQKVCLDAFIKEGGNEKKVLSLSWEIKKTLVRKERGRYCPKSSHYSTFTTLSNLGI